MMLQPWHLRGQRGFTLVELLIVITLIAILAMLVIPRVMSITRRVREVTIASNLYELRLSISKFQADTGVVPKVLTDLIRLKSDAPATGGNDFPITPGLYGGPYFTHNGGINGNGLPVNPLKNTTDPDYAQPEGHWAYDVNTGAAWVFYEGDTLEGVPYSHL